MVLIQMDMQIFNYKIGHLNHITQKITYKELGDVCNLYIHKHLKYETGIL